MPGASDLDHATRLRSEGDAFFGDVAPEWSVWAPNGGYLAAMALRAVLHTSRFHRPVSMHTVFLAPPEPGACKLKVHPLRRGRRAEVMTVTMTQPDRQVLVASVWCTDEVAGLEHQGAPPSVPPPPQREPGEVAAPVLPPALFEQFDVETVESPEGSDSSLMWIRLARPPASLDTAVDAARQLVFADAFMWPAAMRRHGGLPPYIAPSLDLTVSFHRTVGDEWLLLGCESPVATGGLVAGQAHLWSPAGELVATARQQMMCRPLPEGWLGLADSTPPSGGAA